MSERIVINTSPLIALNRMGALDIIGKLLCEFLCPDEVKTEIEAGAAQGYPVIAPSWLKVMPLAAPLSPLVLASLDSGEAAVIQLALEQGIPRVCIDEVKGRRAALSAGLQVVGSLGLVIRAKSAGLIAEIRPLIEQATKAGIHYHPELVRQVLVAVDESFA
jgi:predicted nucleic acid-binding protein